MTMYYVFDFILVNLRALKKFNLYESIMCMTMKKNKILFLGFENSVRNAEWHVRFCDVYQTSISKILWQQTGR